HFGLKTGGTLILGPSENTGDLSSEFETIDQHWKIFKKTRDVKMPADLRMPLSNRINSTTGLRTPIQHLDTSIHEVFEQLLEKTLPPSVVVNDQLDIVHTFGDTSQFIRLRKGVPSLKLTDMLTDNLRTAVAEAIFRSSRENQAVSFSQIDSEREG
ncbi:MAG: hypothetical protein KDA65_07555, partial [Planctomycetaceae bacterium]|nr:hypothetical protein [Planctomycetaceae bacterium]